MLSIPNGVYPTMITPYTPDNKLDFGAVEQLLDGLPVLAQIYDQQDQAVFHHGDTVGEPLLQLLAQQCGIVQFGISLGRLGGKHTETVVRKPVVGGEISAQLEIVRRVAVENV